MQPFTIQIKEVSGKTLETQAVRDQYAWHGDMTLEPHLWSFAKGKGAIIKVKFHEILTTSSFKNRKELCAASYGSVVKGLDLSPVAA